MGNPRNISPSVKHLSKSMLVIGRSTEKYPVGRVLQQFAPFQVTSFAQEMDLSLYPQSVPDSVFPLEECELLQMSNLEDIPNSRHEESDGLTLEDIDGLTDFDEIASPSSLDPGSPCILTTLQDMSYLTDNELSTLPVRDLNKRIRNLPSCEVHKIRKRRRSLKNRGYAYNCRKKRQMHKETLQEEKETLNKELGEVNSKLEQIRKERDMYKEKYERLQHVWNTYCNAAAWTEKICGISAE